MALSRRDAIHGHVSRHRKERARQQGQRLQADDRRQGREVTAIIAHAPLSLGPLPSVVVWWTEPDDENAKATRRVLPLAAWKARFPKMVLLPVEVSSRQWAIYQSELAEKAPVPI